MTENKDSKPTKEHIATILPFQVIEKVLDKPLKIRGIAMTTGISRNFNIYTPQELETFASKLDGAPVYIEHVSVEKAIGKVTKTEWDGQTLWYEAEIYEDDIAEKIRKGIVQHVSVGADYEKVDLVDGKIPHGLCNAELSLVAVPGIPETNISVLESLANCSERKVVKVGSCVFCGSQANYLISSCKPCFEKLSSKGINTIQSKTTEILESCTEALKKTITETIDQANSELRNTKEKLAATENKLTTTEEALSKTNEDFSKNQIKLTEAYKTIEELQKTNFKNGLQNDIPKTLLVSEAIEILEGLLPGPTVERSTLGMQRECQAIRQAIHKLKAKGDLK
jgi:hypothetical protein